MSVIIYILVDCKLLGSVMRISSLKQSNNQCSSQNSVRSSSCSLFQNESCERFPSPVTPFILLGELYFKDVLYGTIVYVECFCLV